MSSVERAGSVSAAMQPHLPKNSGRMEAEKKRTDHSEEAATESHSSEKATEETGGAGQLQELIDDLGYDTKATKLEFAKDPDLEQIVVRVLDRESGEVIREIPPEEMLQVAKTMRKLAETNDALKGNLVRVVT